MSTHSAESQPQARQRVTAPKLMQLKAQSEKIAMLTCYDACFAAVLDQAGVDVLLVGDSLGMVLEGLPSTLPVTLEQMIYHTRCVAASKPQALVVSDMPFGSYQESPESAYRHAAELMAAGAEMVKLEGGPWLLPTVEFLTQRDIPVCAHLGLTPQSVHALGGYKVQGKTEQDQATLKQTALQMQNAGATLVLFEMVPADFAQSVTKQLTVPTIGIGAGPHCDGQVLVLHDMLNILPGKKPRFVRNFMQGQTEVSQAIEAYVQAVKNGSFPAAEHSF